ncbi:MAG TPA: hypothetical protein VD928_02895 [Candidatus Paceibacterota bacterium]|nr:hypothetical protein [Candidatus Paceibacterota bacterium]
MRALVVLSIAGIVSLTSGVEAGQPLWVDVFASPNKGEVVKKLPSQHCTSDISENRIVAVCDHMEFEAIDLRTWKPFGYEKANVSLKCEYVDSVTYACQEFNVTFD